MICQDLEVVVNETRRCVCWTCRVLNADLSPLPMTSMAREAAGSLRTTHAPPQHSHDRLILLNCEDVSAILLRSLVLHQVWLQIEY